MNSKELDTKPASNAWWAARDARMRNIAMSSHYSEHQKLQASRMAGALDLVYTNRDIHVNYRQQFITVKVDGARVKDRRNLDLLEADWAELGIKKRVTDQGVIYRIPRAVDQ